jgi:inhibitor of cysteine peptidase
MALAACGSAERPPANDPPVQDNRGAVPEFSDASAPIRVRPGTNFVITLASNATTGYQWMLADSLSPALLRRVKNEYITDAQPAGSPPVAGAGGHERWTFRALAPGQATIRLIYVRPWEKEQAADTTTYRVIIQ